MVDNLLAIWLPTPHSQYTGDITVITKYVGCTLVEFISLNGFMFSVRPGHNVLDPAREPIRMAALQSLTAQQPATVLWHIYSTRLVTGQGHWRWPWPSYSNIILEIYEVLYLWDMDSGKEKDSVETRWIYVFHYQLIIKMSVALN